MAVTTYVFKERGNSAFVVMQHLLVLIAFNYDAKRNLLLFLSDSRFLDSEQAVYALSFILC